MLNICLSGASGKMGRMLLSFIHRTNNIKLACPLVRSNSPLNGKRVSDILEFYHNSDLKFTDKLPKNGSDTIDIIIDFSAPSAIKGLLTWCYK